MDIHGIIAQSGFEFQKKVFILNLLKIENASYIVYEGLDDVEISNTYFPIASIFPTNNNILIQVKSGVVDEIVLEKIFLNWMFNYDESIKHICFLENDLDIDYKQDLFLEKLITKIKGSARKRSDSILKRAYNLLMEDEKRVIGILTLLIQEAEFKVYNKELLVNDIFQIFVTNYSSDGCSEFTQRERFDEFNRVIEEKISKALYEKQKFQISFAELFNILSDIKAKISKDYYEINLTKFKARQNDKINEIFSKNTRSVKQLRLINNRDSFIIDGLTTQLFYEDLRNYYINVGKELEVDDLEICANSNFKDAEGQLMAEDGEATPAKLYYKTIEKEIRTPLLKIESSQSKFYQKGCYIHLTDDGINEEVRISWGDCDE